MIKLNNSHRPWWIPPHCIFSEIKIYNLTNEDVLSIKGDVACNYLRYSQVEDVRYHCETRPWLVMEKEERQNDSL